MSLIASSHALLKAPARARSRGESECGQGEGRVSEDGGVVYEQHGPECGEGEGVLGGDYKGAANQTEGGNPGGLDRGGTGHTHS